MHDLVDNCLFVSKWKINKKRLFVVFLKMKKKKKRARRKL